MAPGKSPDQLTVRPVRVLLLLATTLGRLLMFRREGLNTIELSG
jgi:hypothetical protein